MKRHAPYFISCTPLGVVSILADILGSTDEIAGKKVALIGRSNIAGMPLYLLLNKYDTSVQVCFSKTPVDDLRRTVEQADIVVAACGIPHLIKSHWLKKGAIAIDVGISFVDTPGSKKPIMTGDIEFNEQSLSVCRKITPVPGGVGPMTVTMLLNNLTESWELSLKKKFIGCELDADGQASLKGRAIEDPEMIHRVQHDFSFN